MLNSPNAVEVMLKLLTRLRRRVAAAASLYRPRVSWLFIMDKLAVPRSEVKGSRRHVNGAFKAVRALVGWTASRLRMVRMC